MPRCLRLAASLCALAAIGAAGAVRAQSVSLNGVTFTNQGLVGVGRIDNAQRDAYRETFGSLSGLAIDRATCRRSSTGTFGGTLYSQPDRGYTKSGATNNYRPRRQKLTLTFKPDANGSSKQDQLAFLLADTLLLTESDGTPLTGLDPTVSGWGTRDAFPGLHLPQAFNGRIALDAEGLALLANGTFFVSDEYGPYLYRFSAAGVLLGAVRPPEALVPRRAGQDSFSSDSSASGQSAPSPSQPTTGRANNKGFEGLALSADGRTLYALMQAAARQDTSSGVNRFARLLAYDLTSPAQPALAGEWVLSLPLYTDGSGAQQVAEAHELAVLDSRRFLVLAHDGNGRGAGTKSLSRAVLIYDLGSGEGAATNIAGRTYDSPANPLVQNGVLANDVAPAASVVLIDINDNNQLSKFSLNNSSNDDSNTLASSWESLALVPALDAAAPDDYFLLVGNDNNFSTSNGFLSPDGATLASFSASPNIDSMVLAYRLTLPGTLAAPAIITQPASTAVTAGQAAALSVSAVGNPALNYQWAKSGSALAGATNATLAFPSAQTTDAGAYTVTITNANGSITSSFATLIVNGTNAPVFTAQPASQTIAAGSTVVFAATAANASSYQWQRDSFTLAGATSRLLVIPGATAADAASYTAVATNASGTAISAAATLNVVNVAPADVGHLINLSVLTSVTANEVLTVGTSLGGAGTSGSKPLLIRAAGPSLAQFGVASVLADPTMTLNNTTASPAVVVDSNDNWGGSAALSNAFATVGAFAYSGANSKDAALFRSGTTALAPGNYTVEVRSAVAGATGAVIAELYDATPGGTFAAATLRLVNVSVLKQISATGSVTAGFTIGGTVAKTVLVRAIGPRLAQPPFNVPGTMPDPRVDVFNITGATTLVASNDNWGGEPPLSTYSAAVGAFAVTDGASRDAMLLVTLAPGNYTAQASAANNVGGLALVEVYEVP